MEISLLHLCKSNLDRDAPSDTAKENYKMTLVQHDTLGNIPKTKKHRSVSNKQQDCRWNNRIGGGMQEFSYWFSEINVVTNVGHRSNHH